MTTPDFQMMLNANECNLIIKSRHGDLVNADLEMLHLISRMNGDGVLIPFFYHKTIYDNNGNVKGREETPTICLLKIEQWIEQGQLGFISLAPH